MSPTASLGPAPLGPASLGPASLGPASLGVDAMATRYGAVAQPARVEDQDQVEDVDLSARAVEMARDGGASAQARVLRDQDAATAKL